MDYEFNFYIQKVYEICLVAIKSGISMLENWLVDVERLLISSCVLVLHILNLLVKIRVPTLLRCIMH